MPSARSSFGRLFGGRASAFSEAVEGREPEPSAFVVGGRARRRGSRRSGEGRRPGSADAARWGPSLQTDGPDGLLDHWTEGPKPRLTPAQLAELSEIVETGPDPARGMASCAGGGLT